jgi:hypothetical protein
LAGIALIKSKTRILESGQEFAIISARINFCFRLIFLLHPQDHYCQNTEALLGKYAMEKKLLNLHHSHLDIIEVNVLYI